MVIEKGGKCWIDKAGINRDRGIGLLPLLNYTFYNHERQ